MKFDKEFDASGLMCPLPIIRSKKHLRDLQPGEVLHIIATSPNTKRDFPVLIKTFADHQIIHTEQFDNEYHFYVKRM